MVRFIIKRLLIMIPTILGILLIIFIINYFAPGDPAMSALGTNYTEEAYLAKRAAMGLDQPFIMQFLIYLKGIILSFDLGTSYTTLRPVKTMVFEALGPTLQIGLLSTLLTVVVGITVGVISAVKQYSAVDYIATALAIFLAAMPGFWLALMCLMLFCINLQWLPASGLNSFSSYILPVLCNALGPIAIVLRMTRTSMLDVINADYIRTARAKGVKEKTVIMRHALRNALIPVITVIGMQLSMVVAGSVVIESIFCIPGVGMVLLVAINNSDYPVIQGCVFILALFICFINLFVDLAYAAVDPRVRSQFTGGKGKRKKKEKVAQPVKETA